ncbi:MAG: hypothetical protein PVI23_03305, partial [Maricaulaceae bacterium]
MSAEQSPSPQSGSPRRWNVVVRWGAIVAFGSATLALGANLKEVGEFFVPDRTQTAVEETRETLELTSAKVDEILRLARESAAMSGFELEADAERAIRAAIEAIRTSGDER